MKISLKSLFAVVLVVFAFSSAGCVAEGVPPAMAWNDHDDLKFLMSERNRHEEELKNLQVMHDAETLQLKSKLDGLEAEIDRLKTWLETGKDPLKDRGPSAPGQQPAPTDGRK
ncbi:MAG: hypothetical protein PHS79_04585 [Patescibacteria group bacterium]|nr:hypothetical protein [Patescibacteria group bacterium]